MRILIGKSGSGKTSYYKQKYPEGKVFSLDQRDDFDKYAEVSAVFGSVLINVYYNFSFEDLDEWLDYNVYIELHKSVKIPGKYMPYVLKIDVNKEEVKAFCGKLFDNWYDAIRYKKYGILPIKHQTRSDLYLIGKLTTKYNKWKFYGSDLLKELQKVS